MNTIATIHFGEVGFTVFIVCLYAYAGFLAADANRRNGK